MNLGKVGVLKLKNRWNFTIFIVLHSILLKIHIKPNINNSLYNYIFKVHEYEKYLGGGKFKTGGVKHTLALP